MNFSSVQAIRVQWAHSLEHEFIRLRLQYYSNPGWYALTPDVGAPVAAFENQSGPWVAIPKFLTQPATVQIRAVIVGDGQADPAITYVTVDTK